MPLLDGLIIVSSLSFLAYGISFFVTPHMQNEFIRFGLARLGRFIAILEIIGAIGLLVGLWVNAILLISSGGLSLLMFMGFIVRLKVKDSLWVSMPALFYLVLNAYIFAISLNVYLD